jgi:fatty-acyl-CoA synthase
MDGGIMNFPLTLAHLFTRCETYFGRREVVTRRPDKSLARSSYGEVCRRARKLAAALTRAGLKRGDRVATLQWNTMWHLECFFGVTIAGGVLHTLNLRLHPDELSYIANHAEDRFLIADDVLLPVLAAFRERVHFQRVWVVPTSGSPVPAGELSYEDLLSGAAEEFEMPEIGETDAATMCYTSGTTGKPKGVVYSHRALALHSFALSLPDVLGFGEHDVVMAASSMFHANAWGFPFAAVMVGAKQVFTGQHFDGESLLELMAGEQVTITGGVPTVWIIVLQTLEKFPGRWKLAPGLRGMSGGSAVPEGVFRRMAAHGIRFKQLWGMTETGPLGTICNPPANSSLSDDERYALMTKQGRPAPFVEIRACSAEGEIPWDGRALGELQTRGPWIAEHYHNSPETRDRWTEDGWFRTGDVVSIDAYGYIRIADRSKDLIKSGGEWISSVDLETALMCHPAVHEAAVIGVPHPKWQERPLAVVVLRDGAEAKASELKDFLAKRFAKWQIPEAIVFAKEIPKTSVGKFLKTRMREQFREWKWEES